MKTCRSKTKRPATGGPPNIEPHIPFLRKVALRVHHELGGTVDLDDLIQDGYFGLAEALAVYDPAKGAAFNTFAHRRVRGAMLDAVRARDWRPRLVEERAGVAARIVADFQNRFLRLPTRTELIDELERLRAQATPVQRRGVFASIDGFIQDARLALQFSLSAAVDEGRDRQQITFMADPSIPPVDASIQHLEFVATICAGFTRQERRLFTSYWIDGLTMREAGQVMGLCETRVSQILANLMARVLARRGQIRELLGLEQNTGLDAQGRAPGPREGSRATDGEDEGLPSPAQDGPGCDCGAGAREAKPSFSPALDAAGTAAPQQDSGETFSPHDQFPTTREADTTISP